MLTGSSKRAANKTSKTSKKKTRRTRKETKKNKKQKTPDVSLKWNNWVFFYLFSNIVKMVRVYAGEPTKNT